MRKGKVIKETSKRILDLETFDRRILKFTERNEKMFHFKKFFQPFIVKIFLPIFARPVAMSNFLDCKWLWSLIQDGRDEI